MSMGWLPFIVAELSREDDDNNNDSFTNNMLYDILKDTYNYIISFNLKK